MEKFCLYNNVVLAVRTLLRGAGQVMLQENARTGLLFAAGVLYGGQSAAVFAGGLLGLVVATLLGRMVSAADTGRGLWGFNGMLVGCAAFVLLPPFPLVWLLAVAGAALTVPLRVVLDRALAPLRTGAFTWPFVLITWALVLVARAAHIGGAVEEAVAAGSISVLSGWGWAEGCLNGISQVFLVQSAGTGGLFVVALALARFRTAVWAVAASLMGMAVALCAGVQPADVQAGLYGFSPVLTAIVVCPLAGRGGWRRLVSVTVAVVITVLVQLLLEQLFVPAGLPVLTAPFCVVACGCVALAAWRRRVVR